MVRLMIRRYRAHYDVIVMENPNVAGTPGARSDIQNH